MAHAPVRRFPDNRCPRFWCLLSRDCPHATRCRSKPGPPRYKPRDKRCWSDGGPPAGTRCQRPKALQPGHYGRRDHRFGRLTVHRLGEKLFYEIPKAMFGREFLLVADQRGTIRGVRSTGVEISNRIVVWERMRSEERRVGKECRSRWSPYH